MTSLDTDCFSLALSRTLSNRYLVSDFNSSFSERWFDSLYFADRIYEELKGRNNLEVFARYQLLIAYYTVLRRMYPFRNQYKKEYQLVIDKIKSTSFKSVLSYMDKKQVFGVLSIKYCILLYKFMRCVSK